LRLRVWLRRETPDFASVLDWFSSTTEMFVPAENVCSPCQCVPDDAVGKKLVAFAQLIER
jgi:hypothetical protein